MAYIPRSYHLADLKPPVGESDPKIIREVWVPGWGRLIRLRTDSDLHFRDIVEWDGILFMVARSIIEHPEYCDYTLMERDKMLELIDIRYNRSLYRPTTHFDMGKNADA